MMLSQPAAIAQSWCPTAMEHITDAQTWRELVREIAELEELIAEAHESRDEEALLGLRMLSETVRQRRRLLQSFLAG